MYNQFSGQVQKITPELFAFQEAYGTTKAISEWAQQACPTVRVPRMGHVRAAVQRQLNEMGVSFPKGKVRITPGYDQFSLGEPPIDYVSRLMVITGDDEDNFMLAMLENLVEDKPKSVGTAVLVHTIVPASVKKVHSVDAITFIAVQASSGESYYFTLGPNDQKGKIIGTEAMQSEFGDIREHFGHIDRCPFKAVPCEANTIMLIREELTRAKNLLVKAPDRVTAPQAPQKSTLQRLGNAAVNKAKTIMRPSKKN